MSLRVGAIQTATAIRMDAVRFSVGANRQCGVGCVNGRLSVQQLEGRRELVRYDRLGYGTPVHKHIKSSNQHKISCY